MRATSLPHPLPAATLAGLALSLLVVGCTGSDSASRASQIDRERAQLSLPGADAFAGGDALTADGYGASDALATDATPGDATVGSGDGVSSDGAAWDGGSSDGAAWDGGADDGGGADGEATDISVADGATSSDAVGSDDSVGGAGGDGASSDGGGATETDTSGTGGADAVIPTDTASASDSAAPADTATATDTTEQNLPPGLQIEFCRLIYPAVFQGQAGTTFDAFMNVSVPGLTNQTDFLPDPAPWLIGQVGWGPIGAIPGHDPSLFTWTTALPDYTPPSNQFWRYDRYVTHVTIAAPGSWDYVGRFSADYGASWVYCDLDGSQNGYLPGEAGRATVTE